MSIITRIVGPIATVRLLVPGLGWEACRQARALSHATAAQLRRSHIGLANRTAA